jgi:hypothetical protein
VAILFFMGKDDEENRIMGADKAAKYDHTGDWTSLENCLAFVMGVRRGRN